MNIVKKHKYLFCAFRCNYFITDYFVELLKMGFRMVVYENYIVKSS